MDANKGKKGPPDGPTKSKEEILAERKAKKAEKQAKKTGGNEKKPATPSTASEPAPVPSAPKEAAPPPASTTAPAAAAKAEDAGKSKAETKAERRQKQEAQRAAKAAGTDAGKPAAAKAPQAKRVPDQIQADRPSVVNRMVKRLVREQVPHLPSAEKIVQLFSHLQQKERRLDLLTNKLSVNQEIIHPSVIKLGLQYASGVVSGSNARAVALLLALKRFIMDYSTPEHKDMSRDLEARLKPNINFLTQCRPMSVSMGNAIRYLKWHITHKLRDYTNDAEGKAYLLDLIDKYIHENVELAGRAICDEAGKKIASGDVILTYGYSSLLLNVLLKAYVEDGKKFRVVVLDSNPRFEGKQLLRRLTAAGIPATYMLISGASYIMPEVTKVMLGAYALLANGYVMSRVGSSQVALVARAHKVPVLVCCETYKINEKVQTDSFVFNELGDPNDLVSAPSAGGKVPPASTNPGSVTNWRDISKLYLLNLMYDVTPGDFVTAVITELAILPCTSGPVVLRLKSAETS